MTHPDSRVPTPRRAVIVTQDGQRHHVGKDGCTAHGTRPERARAWRALPDDDARAEIVSLAERLA